MEPLAANINCDDNYGTTAIDNQTREKKESKTAALPQIHIELTTTTDATDFSLGRATDNVVSERKNRIQNLPALKVSVNSQSPILGSPDSDTDILGYLDHTPDPFSDVADNVGSISYSKVYYVTKFSELMPGSYVPNCSVHLNISQVESVNSNIGLNIFSSPLLVIDLDHGEFKWTVRKKVSQVTTLHSQLLFLRTKLKLPAATRETRQKRQSMRIQMRRAEKISDLADDGKVNNPRMMKFPRRALQTMDKSAQSELQTYLRNLLFHPLYRNHQGLLEFLEISPLSFITELGSKNKEGYVKKRIGSYNSNGCCAWCSSPCAGRYKQKWLVLKETCLFFLDPETGDVRCPMLMDSYFEVSHGYRIVGVRNALLISNLSRSVIFKCDSEVSQKEWIKQINKTKQKHGKDFTSTERRYDSFAPVRSGSYARWYVDGSRYMWDVADMLELAKEEIFITDWWMSPEIYMKRPDLTGCKWRLAEVLKRQAERGVQVFILLYKEVELALGISSTHTKQTVGQLHHNIKILRHPDHYAGGVLYWAHHEKVVIIDQMYAFVSGIDLAFGRWDDSRHKLTDVGHAGLQPSQSAQSPVPQGVGSAVMQLVKGTNEVLVSTVTKSNSSSRKSSIDNSNSGAETLNTTVSSVFSSQLETQRVDSEDVSRKLEQESGSQYKDIEENGTQSGDVIKNNGEINSVLFMQGETKEEPENSDHLSVIDKISLSSHSMKSIKKRRFLRREARMARNAATLHQEDEDEEEEGQSEGRMGKGFKEVKKMGLELVEEVKEKGREVRAWTATKLPHLHRRNSSGSEVSDSDETDDTASVAKSIYKFHRNKLGDRAMMGSTSSLAQAHSALTKEDTTSIHLWVGKDYVNWISKDLTNLDKPFKDIVNRHQTPRMPWHDIGLFVEGSAARDAARHFIQRWNAIKTEKAKQDSFYPYLLPRTYSKKSFASSPLMPKHKVKCQVVRSVGKWSAGIEENEFSIFTAYVDLIRRAKHYIYIENQFFITCANLSDAKDVTNSIAHEIVERIVHAHSKGKVFRVFVLLPLLPAFEGMIGKSSGVAMQYIVYWNYVSISRGKTSLIQCLKDRGITDWRKYISFCSLRTHEELGGRPISELIYIHSKLMIIDDRYVIAGSANINDRSLIGNRDSEVCLVLEDEEYENGIMNGHKYDSGVFAGSLRRYLFCEHLGIADDQEEAVRMIADPISEEFFTGKWCTIAATNTRIYEEVFSCYPCDNAKTFEDVERLRHKSSLAEMSPAEAQRRLKNIKGHLVQFPLEFLKDEVLKPGVGSKEYLLPMEMWI